METRNLKFGILSVCSYLSFELLSQNIERPNILWLTYEAKVQLRSAKIILEIKKINDDRELKA